MRLPPVGWAFFSLAVFVVAFYGLSLGIFIGSETEYNVSNGSQNFYALECRYLYLSGIRKVFGGGTGHTPEEAANDGFCPTFGPN